LEEAIKRNNATINDLRKADPRRNKDVLAVESKIEETGRNIARLEKILSEIRSNPQGEEVKNAKGKQK
jgi:ferritin-like metal-binding protein YciE